MEYGCEPISFFPTSQYILPPLLSLLPSLSLLLCVHRKLESGSSLTKEAAGSLITPV